MKRILWFVLLALALLEIHSPAQGQGSPIGPWDAKTPARGQLVFVFSPDQTFISYGVSLNFGGLFLLTGTWTAVGTQLSGHFQQVNPPVAGYFAFTGNYSDTSLEFVVTGGSRSRLRCKPLVLPTVVTGDWNVQTTKGTNLTSMVSITESNNLPRVFAIDDTGLTGVMMVDAKGKALAVVNSGSLEVRYRGKFKTDEGTASLNGRDQGRHAVKWKLEVAP